MTEKVKPTQRILAVTIGKVGSRTYATVATKHEQVSFLLTMEHQESIPLLLNALADTAKTVVIFTEARPLLSYDAIPENIRIARPYLEDEVELLDLMYAESKRFREESEAEIPKNPAKFLTPRRVEQLTELVLYTDASAPLNGPGPSVIGWVEPETGSSETYFVHTSELNSNDLETLAILRAIIAHAPSKKKRFHIFSDSKQGIKGAETAIKTLSENKHARSLAWIKKYIPQAALFVIDTSAEFDFEWVKAHHENTENGAVDHLVRATRFAYKPSANEVVAHEAGRQALEAYLKVHTPKK